MRWLNLVGLTALAMLGVACSSGGPAPDGGGLSGLDPSRQTTVVTLPDGAEITAELVRSRDEQGQGMMFRRRLRADEGMLFPFEEMAPRGFWMFQTLIPLDIIWLNDNKRIVEISERTPPCSSSDAAQCPTYGGMAHSIYVLELASGQASAHGLTTGSELQF
jgi:uncharacterized membrane protein (UPF0127 family)